MNKAFTKESDEEPEEPLLVPRSAQLPSGTPNYMTSDGAQRMREELGGLEARAAAAIAHLADAEAKRALLRDEQRIQYLRDCLRTAVPVNAAAQDSGKVCFGATVTVLDHAQAEFSYRIVGVDEIDLNRGWISWLSPLARALLNTKTGDSVQFKTPRGEEQLRVQAIAYLA
jgi:transcription elongation factor GreB